MAGTVVDDQPIRAGRGSGAKGVSPNVPWLRRQMQLRCWTLDDFSRACEATGEPVSTATISGALNGMNVMRAKYVAMVAAIQSNDPILPEEALAE